MKAFIHDVHIKNKLFYCIINRKKVAFYLSNRLSKVFLGILKKNQLVDFEVLDGINKKINGNIEFVFPVLHFNSIIQLEPRKVLYDLKKLRLDMKSVLKKYQHFLFLDLEMSMPGYGVTKFKPEILQVGIILSNLKGEVLVDKGYYVLPQDENAINKRTTKFLKLDELEFFGKAYEYIHFYEDLKSIIETYNPQIVVWGKNDIQALKLSYQLHEVKPLTHDKQFIDLLKLHKDYFNLPNDLGLFDAYTKYYQIEEDLIQDHDARLDAMITKDVFDAFMKQMK